MEASSSGLFDTLDTIYLQEQTKAVFKHNQIGSEFLTNEVPTRPQYACRICLEPCPNIQFCLCSGGLLNHEKCLIEYLMTTLKTKRLKLKELKCQICQQRYKVETTFECRLSKKDCYNKICENKFKCGLYSFFYFIVLVFYCYMGYLFSINKISSIIKTSLIILTVCLTLIFAISLGVWTHHYLLQITEHNISRIFSLNKQKPRVGSGSPKKIHPMPDRSIIK